MVHGKPRHYLVESYRDQKTGKARQRVRLYLGSAENVRALKDGLKNKIRALQKIRERAPTEMHYHSGLKANEIPPPRLVRGKNPQGRAIYWKWANKLERATRGIERLEKRIKVINAKTKDM